MSRIYTKDIERLLAKSTMTAREIAKEVGCSIPAVYAHSPKGCFKHLPRIHKHIDGMQWCSKCKQYHPESNFFKDKYTPSGFARVCKECDRKRVKEYRLKKRLENKDE